MELVKIAEALVHDLKPLKFGPPVTHIYNPLKYASVPYQRYVERYGRGPKEVILVGMNPGPFGMTQTGVPFGAVPWVRDWMGIEGPVGKPLREHPQRPVDGFACARIEVSGQRLWQWARDHFGSAERFFARFFVSNYCPLVFMEQSGRNRTPDKLPVTERQDLYACCDRALCRTVEVLQPRYVIGIGGFAEARVKAALATASVRTGQVLHPSPASPVANRGWAARASAQLEAYGITIH